MSKILISCKRSTCPKIKAKAIKMVLKYNPTSQIKSKVQRIMLKEKEKKKTGKSMSVCVCLNYRSIIGSASSSTGS